MTSEEFDWRYYEDFNDDIRNGRHFDNNFTCWRIIKSDHENSRLRTEIDDLRKLLSINHKFAPKTFIDIILYIEYLEWKLYLFDVRKFMRMGINFGIFNTNTLVKELKIERFKRRFNSLMFSKECFLDRLIDNKEDASFFLTYNLDFEQFTFLDVSIATGIPGFIKHAINIGCDKCIENSYIIPELGLMPLWHNGEEEYSRCFMSNLIIHERIYTNYKSIMNKSNEVKNVGQATNTSESNGIWNILTGEIVHPKDGTYYIDDFR